MTQETLAEAVGVSLTFLRSIETAKAPASLTVLVSIADALGVPLVDLVQPAVMPEIRTGRPPKVRAASPGKPPPAKARRKKPTRKDK